MVVYNEINFLGALLVKRLNSYVSHEGEPFFTLENS